VIHRRLLGRPTFGRWEIDQYFAIAARSGFYGVVDAIINSPEYCETFGEDTVPYERFITPTDLNSRRVPALRRPFQAGAYADFTLAKRPDVAPSEQLRTGSGDPVPRNLTSRPVVRGGWMAEISGGQIPLAPVSAPSGPGSVRQPPPSRRWRELPSRPGSTASAVWQAPGDATPATPTAPPSSESST
jgi:phycobilisome core-membrane linker protein